MAKISIFDVISNVQMLLHTKLFGVFVGEDQFGNRYYRGKPRAGRTRERRWVLYKGQPEATSVPPEWWGWLHGQTDAAPSGNPRARKAWQKPPQQNVTGTPSAYVPPGHTLRGAKRDAATGDYTAWQPPH